MNTNTKKPSNAFERLLATSQKNPIYRRYLPISEMFGNLDYRGTYESSLSFHKEEKERNEDVLVKNILDENSDFDAFHDALEQLYQGDGNEEENILCFHSSSLCALLHFYDLKRNTFSLFLRPNHYEVEEKFRPNEVSFEVKRPLFEHSSNIDVCLRGSAGDRDVELNLESKYSEYLKLSRKKKYSLHYLPLFQQYLQNIEGLSCYEEEGMAVLQSSFPRYLEMFKQMIAHFEAISQAKEKTWIHI